MSLISFSIRSFYVLRRCCDLDAVVARGAKWSLLHKGLLAYDPAAPIVLHERGVLGSSLGRRGLHFGISGLQENFLRFVAVNPGHWWQVTVFFVARGCGGHSNGIKSMLRRTHSGLTMDTVVATEADAPRRRGTKFKLTYRKICELSVAKGPIEGKQGSAVIAPAPNRGREARPGAGRQPGAPTGVGFYVGTTWTAYKLQVAKMIRGQGMSVMQVRRDQHLVERAVRRWLAQYDAEQAPAWSGHPLTSEQQYIDAGQRSYANHSKAITGINHGQAGGFARRSTSTNRETGTETGTEQSKRSAA